MKGSVFYDFGKNIFEKVDSSTLSMSKIHHRE